MRVNEDFLSELTGSAICCLQAGFQATRKSPGLWLDSQILSVQNQILHQLRSQSVPVIVAVANGVLNPICRLALPQISQIRLLLSDRNQA